MYFQCLQGIGPTAQVDVHLPRSFADIVRNTYTFQLKLKDFNITVNHQAFTISRIFHARDLASIITFVVSIVNFLNVKLMVLEISEYKLFYVAIRKLERLPSQHFFRMCHQDQKI